MLVLTRKQGESFTITKGGDQVKITIIKKSNGRMTIGVTASADHKIVRDNAKKVN